MAAAERREAVNEDVNPNASMPEDDDMTHASCSDDGYLLQPEDIDFQFVYALHTFVATVEGQANATKGDTMVLLDDSNSYWWLVRVVKDSSIGEPVPPSTFGRPQLLTIPYWQATFQPNISKRQPND